MRVRALHLALGGAIAIGAVVAALAITGLTLAGTAEPKPHLPEGRPVPPEKPYEGPQTVTGDGRSCTIQRPGQTITVDAMRGVLLDCQKVAEEFRSKV